MPQPPTEVCVTRRVVISEHFLSLPPRKQYENGEQDEMSNALGTILQRIHEETLDREVTFHGVTVSAAVQIRVCMARLIAPFSEARR